VPALVGTWNSLPPSNSTPRWKFRMSMPPIAISSATAAMVNHSRRRPTTLSPASPL
jgi:hypothetical protein